MTIIDQSLLRFAPLSGTGSPSEQVGLPARHVLPPDGHGIESHFDTLYPANLGERQLLAFARPSADFHELLRPQAFRQSLAELREALRGSGQPVLVAAFELLRSRGEDEQLLRLAVHLLHKV